MERPDWLVGVTGTNGKTTTATVIGHLLASAGWRVCTVTTVETRVAGEPHSARELRAVLKAAVGCRAVVQEATSFSLQHGLARTPFDAAVFTNLTHDHLDQHGGSFEHYLAAKAQLFTSLARSQKSAPIAVLNADHPASALLAEILPPKVRRVSYGWHAGTGEHLRGELAQGQLFAGGYRVPTPLPGRHMAENVLAALALVSALGIDLASAVEATASFEPVRGRFEVVGHRPTVVVDYAHSPDALERTLETARAQTRGRVWVVFGCGGGRDLAKRPVMGAIAARLADRVVVTTDNPRKEDPAAIAAQVLAGIPAGQADVIADRAHAIAYAVQEAAEDDLVLIAGKGHELVQELAAGTLAFDDRAIAKAALRCREPERGGDACH